ncbi:MAG TPA: hypothetical protein VJ327_00265 [Patescibacteria group bacterium]|nr:hypothetical protein [Patescibacteria group bacterium]
MTSLSKTMGDRPKISVWLDDKKNDELKKFHCLHCGKVVFEYYNSAKIIVPGEMGETKKSPIVVQCNGAMMEYDSRGYQFNSRCKAKYWIE